MIPESYEAALQRAADLPAGPLLEDLLIQIRNLRGQSGEAVWALAEAMALWKLDKYKEAQACLESASSDLHQFDKYWLLMGMACSALENEENSARIAYKKAIEISPHRADAHYNLANLLIDINPLEAESTYNQSLLLDPFQPFAWHNLGLLIRDQFRYKEACNFFQISLVLKPDHPDGWCNYGLSLMGLDKYSEAEACFSIAMAYDQKHVASHVNMGTLLVKCFRPEEALIYLERGVELEKTSAHALWNLGLCHLLLGRFETGWRLYEARLQTHLVPQDLVPTVGLRISNFDQLNKNGKEELVIWCEQGLGDSIQFSRYLNLLHAKDISFELHCPAKLLSLFRDWFNAPWLKVKAHNLEKDQNDHRPHLPLMSLPALFKSNLVNLPSSLPYLHSPCETPTHLQLEDPPGGLSIGVVWAANPSNAQMYKHKSLPLEILMPKFLDLLSLDLIDLHCLQVGEDASQLSPWLDHPRIFDWSNFLNDFADTAHVVKQLDLVISVDTAVAHLSGALNRPTWLLLPRNPDFRWLLDTEESPWYPSCMRLFRQKTQGDWLGVLDQLQKALDRLFLLDLTELASAKLH